MLHLRVIGGKRERKEVLGYLALMEEPASHPLSDAIVTAAVNGQVPVPDICS
jgi:cation transport ATPase